MKIRVRWKAVPVAVGVVLGVLADPNVIGALTKVVPPGVGHWLLAAAAVAAVLQPAVATKHPPRDGGLDPVEKKIDAFGLNDDPRRIDGDA